MQPICALRPPEIVDLFLGSSIESVESASVGHVCSFGDKDKNRGGPISVSNCVADSIFKSGKLD